MVVWAVGCLAAAGGVAAIGARAWSPAPLIPLVVVLASLPYLFAPIVVGPVVAGFVVARLIGSSPGRPRRQGVELAILAALLVVVGIAPAFGSLGS